MSEIIGFDLTPDMGTSLRKVLKYDLAPHIVEFESISAGASKVRDRVTDARCCQFSYLLISNAGVLPRKGNDQNGRGLGDG